MNIWKVCTVCAINLHELDIREMHRNVSDLQFIYYYKCVYFILDTELFVNVRTGL